MAAVVVDPTAWTSGSPIYYLLSVGNEAFNVHNAGSGYTFDKNATHALTSLDNNKLRFEVRSGDQNWYDKGTTSERSEIASTVKIERDTPLSLSYKFSLEEGAPNTAKWMLLGQLHVVGEAARPPEVAFELVGETMRIVARHLDANGKTVTKVVWTDDGPIERGHEYDMQVKAVFDPDGSDGRLVVVRDGKVIVDYSGQLGYTDCTGVYWKEGVYRSPATETVAATFGDLKISTGAGVEIPAKGAPYVPQAAAPTLAVGDGSISNGEATVTLTGTAAAGTVVKIYDGGKLVGETKADAKGHYSVELKGLGTGAHKLTATSTDASGRLSQVSTEKVVEVGSTADIKDEISRISAKDGLAGIFFTDDNTITVSSLAEMRTLIADFKDALAKIHGGYDFEFWSGTTNNRTLSRYEADGTLVDKETKTYKDGVLIKHVLEHFGDDHAIVREIAQYAITGKTYVSTYQGYDDAGKIVLSTRTFANGSLEYEMKIAADGTSTTKNWLSDGNLSSVRTALPNGDVIIETYTKGVIASRIDYLGNGSTLSESFNAAGELISSKITNPDKSSESKTFVDGVLTARTVVHADSDGTGIARDVFNYNIKNASYTTSQQSWAPDGTLVSVVRTHADGTLDYTYSLKNGLTTREYYDAKGTITSQAFVLADKSTSTRLFTDGVLTKETIVLPSGGEVSKAKLVYEFNITGQEYGSKLTIYNIWNKVSSTQYFSEPVVPTSYSALLPGIIEAIPSLLFGGVLKAPTNGGSMAPKPPAEGGADADASHGVTLQGTGTAGSTIRIYDGAKQIGTAVVGADGKFTFVAADLGPGSHSLSATSTSAAGKVSESSSKLSVEVLTAAQFVERIDELNGKAGLATVILTDTNALTIPQDKLAAFIATYNKALGAIDKGFTLKVPSEGGGAVSTYDAAGKLVETVSKAFSDGVLVREIVRQFEDGKQVRAEEHRHAITGEAYTSTNHVYDASGKLVLLTRSYADGALEYEYDALPDGGSLTRTFDTGGRVLSRMEKESDGSYVYETFGSGSAILSSITRAADGSVVTKYFKDGDLVSHTIKHAPGSQAVTHETYTYGVENQSYTSMHVQFKDNKIVSVERFHDDGTFDSTFSTAANGSTTTTTYTDAGQLLKKVVVNSATSGAEWPKETYNYRTDGSVERIFHDDKGRAQISSVTHADHSATVTLKAAGLSVASTGADETFVSFRKDGFFFGHDFGNDTIENFHAGKGGLADTIKFATGVFLNDNPLAQAHQVGDDVVITALNEDTITLSDVHLSQLNPFNFLLT